ncbi:MAG: porin family protein [Prevotella sp.]|jgi:hypothetical protein
MKKTLLMLVLLMTVTAASAQYYPDGRPIPPSKRASYYNHRNNYDHYHDYGLGRTYYGFRVGLGVATVNSDADDLDGGNAKTGLNVGFVVGTQLTDRAPLYFETGLYYTEKGGKGYHDGSKFTYGLNYLEVPLLLKYKYSVAPDFTIEPFMGGYLACGVSGKIKDYGNREAYSSFDSDYDSSFKRFDGGLRLGCGFGFQMLYLGVSYDIGLANVGRSDFDDTHTGTLNINVGVNF